MISYECEVEWKYNPKKHIAESSHKTLEGKVGQLPWGLRAALRIFTDYVGRVTKKEQASIMIKSRIEFTLPSKNIINNQSNKNQDS